MTPGTYNLVLYRGDTQRWTFKLWTDPNKTTPLDLTGVVVKAEIREKSGGSLITVMNCVISQPPTLGEIKVNIDPDDYTAMPASGVWDLQLTYANTDVHTAIAGKVTVTPDVTDSAIVARRAGQLTSINELSSTA